MAVMTKAGRKWVVGILMAAAVGGLAPPAHAQRRNNNNNDTDAPTDAEVLESIRKGVNFLMKQLAEKNPANNWESKFNADQTPSKGDETWNIWNCGGETGLALYALLHVGQGVTEDREMGGMLKFNSKELAPVVKWLSGVRPDTTYSAGLQSSALGMIPKDTDNYKAAQVALRSNSYYLSTAMTLKGGYTYGGPIAAVPPNHKKPRGVLEVWRWYWEAKQANKLDVQSIPSLQAISKMAGSHFGGFDMQSQWVAWDMMQREAEAKAAGKANIVAGIQLEKKEYARLVTELKALQGDKNDSGMDLSNSQYGVLGAWALTDAGVELPKGYWELADKFWRVTQHADGQWPYDANPNGQGVRPSMTVAGIASLYITSNMLDTTLRLENKPDQEIDRGIAWLNRNFEPTEHWYYMYGVERVGLASGLKFFGTTNWYTQGAKLILQKQRPDGGWEGGEGTRTVATAYALLFLARGRNPVVFNKLEYTGNTWNARPRDSANLTGWISKESEQALNWQVVNMKVDADEWSDAPILLITGSKPLDFKEDEIKKLRDFVNAGGMIFSNADGDKAMFTESVKKLASKLVDEGGKPKYEMREIDKTHPLFSQKNELWKPVGVTQALPKIFAMSNGVREIWVHTTVDMAANWQMRKYAKTEDFIFAMNLYRYATGKQSPRSKLQPLVVDVANAPAAARTINLARVDYSGNWDPEPGAWVRMSKIMKRDAKTDLKVTPVKIANLDPKATPVAHITGTTGFPANPADVAAVKKYIEGGGTLIADAAGGVGDFKSSFEKFVTALELGQLQEIPLNHKMLDGSIADSQDVTKTEYRALYRLKVGNKTNPQLQGVEVNGRMAIIYAGEDITSGLLGTNTYGIYGYTSTAAQNLARNLLLYANEAKDGNAAAPAAAAGK